MSNPTQGKAPAHKIRMMLIPKPKQPKEQLPACRNCHHYFLTWEPRRPHGCRVMGFKSRRSPYLEVLRATPGMICLHFSPRD